MYQQQEINAFLGILTRIQEHLSSTQDEFKWKDLDDNSITLSIETILSEDNIMCFDPESALENPEDFIGSFSFVHCTLYIQSCNEKIAILKMGLDTCMIEYIKNTEGPDVYLPEYEATKDLQNINYFDWKEVLYAFIKNIADVFKIVKREFVVKK